MAVIGTLTGINLEKIATLEAYKAAFGHNAVILNDVAFGIPAPLVGFTYTWPKNLEFLKYSYSEYPFLDKRQLVNSYVKELPSLTIVARRQITNFLTVPSVIIANIATLNYLEKYADSGGTFSLLSMWGFINNLVLENLEAEEPENGAVDGTSLVFTFKRLNIDTAAENVVSSKLVKLGLGIL